LVSFLQNLASQRRNLGKSQAVYEENSAKEAKACDDGFLFGKIPVRDQTCYDI